MMVANKLVVRTFIMVMIWMVIKMDIQLSVNEKLRSHLVLSMNVERLNKPNIETPKN